MKSICFKLVVTSRWIYNLTINNIFRSSISVFQTPPDKGRVINWRTGMEDFILGSMGDGLIASAVMFTFMWLITNSKLANCMVLHLARF